MLTASTARNSTEEYTYMQGHRARKRQTTHFLEGIPDSQRKRSPKDILNRLAAKECNNSRITGRGTYIVGEGVSDAQEYNAVVIYG